VSKANAEKKNKNTGWVAAIFLITILISGIISLISEELIGSSGLAVAFIILLLIVFIGIVFDVIGVAVTSADESPFHAMAARKLRGAKEAIRLLRKADRVSSICNDVVGDICGVVSGSASATIAAQVLQNFDGSMGDLVCLLMSALVAALTVSGKAIGKTLALNSCTQILTIVGRIIYYLGHIPQLFKRKNHNS
jgi:CBS domain containing-hemolysin-like protein